MKAKILHPPFAARELLAVLAMPMVGELVESIGNAEMSRAYGRMMATAVAVRDGDQKFIEAHK